MVETAKRPYSMFKGRGTKWFALGAGVATAAIAVAASIAAESLLPLVAILNVGALVAMGAISLKVDGSSQELRRVVSDLGSLAIRVTRLERQAQGTGGAAAPVLHSTMAEVTGTVGLLGGVVRELARNVAAQNQDVADLKSTLRPASPEAVQAPALRVGPELRAQAVADRTMPAQIAPAEGGAGPEPSLLPLPGQGGMDQGSKDQDHPAGPILQAFAAESIELHLQPVLALPERRVRSYEALARLRLADGTLIGPAEFLPLLERTGHAPAFDRAMLRRAVTVARHLVARGSEAVVTVNLSPRSLSEPGFLLSVLRLLAAAPEVTGKIVLEWPGACWKALDMQSRDMMLALCGRGVPLSVDGAGDLSLRDLHLDVRSLAEHGVRYVKLPAETILAAARDPEGDQDIRDLIAHLRRSGIRLVAERVERDETVPALAELGVPLAQGFVFAAPRAVRAEILGGTAGQAAFSAEAEPVPLRRAG